MVYSLSPSSFFFVFSFFLILTPHQYFTDTEKKNVKILQNLLAKENHSLPDQAQIL